MSASGILTCLLHQWVCLTQQREEILRRYWPNNCFFSAFDVNNSQHDDPFYHSLVMWMFVTLWGWGQKEKRKPGKQKRLTIRWEYSPPSLVYEQCTLPLCYSSWHRCGQVRFVELNRPIVWPSSLWSEAGVPIEASSWHPFSMVVGSCHEWASPDNCG